MVYQIQKKSVRMMKRRDSTQNSGMSLVNQSSLVSLKMHIIEIALQNSSDLKRNSLSLSLSIHIYDVQQSCGLAKLLQS